MGENVEKREKNAKTILNIVFPYFDTYIEVSVTRKKKTTRAHG